MTGEALVSVAGVSRYYGDRCAVSDLEFNLDRGQVLGLLGPNGAGKTTTMQMLAGVLPPSQGRVCIVGHDIHLRPQQAKLHIGYLPDQPPLYTDLTVDEYLLFCARLHRLSGSAARDAVSQSKTRCGLEAVGRRLIANLSRGFQQRTGIAQAILHAPSVIILDEPTTGLDPGQNLELRKLIRSLGREHAVILSTHILSEVEACCDRVQIIHEGRLVLDEAVHKFRQSSGPYRFAIALMQPPALEALCAIRGITAVESGGDQRFHIECEDATHAPARLVEAAAASGWGLYELAPVRDSLEATYLRLTRDADASAASEGGA